MYRQARFFSAVRKNELMSLRKMDTTTGNHIRSIKSAQYHVFSFVSPRYCVYRKKIIHVQMKVEPSGGTEGTYGKEKKGRE